MIALSARFILSALWTLFAGQALAAAAPVATGPVTQAEWARLLATVAQGGTVDLGSREVLDASAPPLQPAKTATIRGGVYTKLNISNWRNVVIDGARFVGPPGTPTYHNLVFASDVENVVFRNCVFTGYQTPDGELHVRGPSIRDSRNVTIEKSRFENMAGFTHFFRTVGGRFLDNDLKTMREGLDIMGGGDIVIERNRFEDFQPFNGDHADAVQFFTTGLDRPGDLATRGALVRDNLILADGRAQGVFTNDEIRMVDTGRNFADFVIEDNLIVGAAYHGVTTTNIDRGVVRNNRIVRIRGKHPYEGRVTQSGGSVTITGNEAGRLLLEKGGSEKGNRIVQDRNPAEVQQLIDDWMRRNRPAR